MNVLITGGSEGIGYAIAAEAVKAGASVTLWARDPAKLAEAAASLNTMRRKGRPEVAVSSVDVSDPTAVRAAAEAYLSAGAPPDRLFHCAGFAIAAFLEDVRDEHVWEMLAVNAGGPIHVARAFAPAMAKRSAGAIVTTASDLGYLGLFGWSVYTASKHAVVGFSSALRHELKPFGVTVQTLCPPATRTPGFDRENLTKPQSVAKAEAAGGIMSAKAVGRYAWKRAGKGGFFLIPSRTSRFLFALSRLSPTGVQRFVPPPGPGGER